jgi:hypothetical protein
MLRLVLAMLTAASLMPAAILTSTLPEYDGAGVWPATETVGTFTYTIPLGETILSATVTGTMGNSSSPTTAVMDVLVDGVLVAQCPDEAAACWSVAGPHPFSYSFLPAEFAVLLDNAADLTVNQLDCCVIRLGETTLTIVTGAVPEPGGFVLLAGGLGALVWRLRRRR